MSGSRRMVMSGSSAAGGIKGATPGAEDESAGQLTPSVWLSPPENEGLAGKTAIVTGAGRNLGRAIALGAAGANVVVNARSNTAEAEAVTAEVNAGNGRAIAAVGDVGDPAFDERMVQRAIDEFGAVDVLVNNAGVRKRQPILEITP